MAVAAMIVKAGIGVSRLPSVALPIYTTLLVAADTGYTSLRELVDERLDEGVIRDATKLVR
jgi:hypothetical protein